MISNLTHAILIEGGNPETRMDRALQVLCGFLSDDPYIEDRLSKGVFEDLKHIDRGKNKSIGVDSIKEDLIPFFLQKPFASTGRACIISEGDAMTPQAQNKLLKLLEEPAAGYIIMILTANADKLLPTIRSRCVRIWLGYDIPEQGPVTDAVKQLAYSLIYGKGSFAEACRILSHYEGSREEAIDFLSVFQLFLRGLSVGRYSPGLITGDAEYSERIRESAGKVKQAHAELIREGVLRTEKAQNDIEHGYNKRYVMRSMALSMRGSVLENGGS
jgi:hypothetical protein